MEKDKSKDFKSMRYAVSLIILFLCLWLSGCINNSNDNDQIQILGTQTDTQIMNNERFNIEGYEKRKAEGTTEFEEDDGTLVLQIEVGKDDSLNYIEYRTPPPPALFMSVKRFYSDGKLKIVGQRFHSKFNAGVWKTYDEAGNLIETTDYDKPYNLTVEDFITIVKAYQKEQDIPEANIWDNRTTITRQETSPENLWFFSWEAVPGRIEMLKFSDNTGEMLEKSHYEIEDN